MAKWQSCLQCGGQVKKERALYCSDACKMKAYRRRLDPLAGSSISNKQRIRQSVVTKSSQVVDYVCPVCGGDYKRSGLEALREYCSDACKQKAYRARKKESSALWAVGDRVTTDTGRDAIIKEMRGTTACIVTEKIGNASIDRYHTLKRLAPAAPARPTPAPYALYMGDHPYIGPDPAAPAAPAPLVQTERVAFSTTMKKVTTMAEHDPQWARLRNVSKVKINKPDSHWYGHVGRLGPASRVASKEFEGMAWVYFPNSENPHVGVPFEREFLEAAD